MKLVTAIVQDEDVNRLLDSLVEAGHRVTKISSTGGFLRRGNSTLLSAVEDHQVEPLKEIIARKCRPQTESVTLAVPGGPLTSAATQPPEVAGGGAVVFVQDLERYLRF